MKYLVHSLIAIFLTFSSVTAMEAPETQTNAATKNLGWIESFLPSTFTNASKGTEAVEKIAKDGLTVNVKHELEDFTADLSENGIKMVVDPVSIRQVNAASNNMVKTWITAGAGGALTLAGVVLLLHTLMKKSEESEESDKSWYMRIVTNRYLISALLMASGLTLVLKSDTLVAKTA
jgi:hypothetical protein